MTYETALVALADPTRRRIFEALRASPRTVSEIADRQPVSRPAVSQHLKVLQEAELVAVERRGTRRIYSIRREGLSALRDYLDGFWDEVLDEFRKEVVRTTERSKRRSEQ